MRPIYIETSAVLAWLLGEPAGKKIVSILNNASVVTSSVLTLVETERCLIRAQTRDILNPADRQRLKGMLARAAAGWTLMEMTNDVQARAKESFPSEPIRTLDAIHLATALEFVKVFPNLNVVTNDQRIISNLKPLGLPRLPR